MFDLLATNEKYADERCAHVESFFLRQAFKTAGQYFSVFPENSTDVLVPYGRGKQLIEELCTERCRFDLAYRAAVLKEASDYTVGIYPYQKKQLEQKQALISACEDCVWILADGFYDEDIGLLVDAKDQVFMEV